MNTKKFLAYSLFAFTALFMCGAVITTFNFYQKQRDSKATSIKEAEDKISFTASELDLFISTIKPSVDRIADNLTSLKLHHDALEQELKKKPRQALGLGVAFKPDQEKLYAPYFVDKKGASEVVQLGIIDNYVASADSWYHKAINHGPGYYGPFEDKTTQQLIMTYAAPFYTVKNGDKIAEGVVFATQSIGNLDYLLSTFYLGQSGYWFIANPEGKIISHPNHDITKQETTIQAFGQNLGHDLVKTFSDTQSGDPHEVSFINEFTQAPATLYLHAVGKTGFVLGGVFSHLETPIRENTIRQVLMLVVLLLVGALVAFLIALFLLTRITPWQFSAIAALILFIGIAAFWYINSAYLPYFETLDPIKDKASLYNQLKNGSKLEPDEKKDKEESLVDWLSFRSEDRRMYVPTGIEINDVIINQNSQIEFFAFIWQRYTKGVHDGIEHGFVLPQAAQIPSVDLIAQSEEGDVSIYIWQVQAVLNQDIGYLKYPFDVKNLEIQLWHKDFDQGIVLIPDLDSYPDLNPSGLPGLGQLKKQAGWFFRKSYFTYRSNPFTSQFGLYAVSPFGLHAKASKFDKPQLNFNFTVQRSLLYTLAIDVGTIFIILLLLFMVLLTHRTDESSFLDLIGGAIVTILFSALVALQSLLTKSPAYEFTYLESLYFVIYLTLIAINGILLCFRLKKEPRWLTHKDNLLTKILFWPLIFGAVFLITFYYLY